MVNENVELTETVLSLIKKINVESSSSSEMKVQEGEEF